MPTDDERLLAGEARRALARLRNLRDFVEKLDRDGDVDHPLAVAILKSAGFGPEFDGEG